MQIRCAFSDYVDSVSILLTLISSPIAELGSTFLHNDFNSANHISPPHNMNHPFHLKPSSQVLSHNLIHFFLATLSHPPHSLLFHLHRLPLVPNFHSFSSNAFFLINSFFSHTIFTGSSYTHYTSSLIFFTSADTPSPLPCLVTIYIRHF